MADGKSWKKALRQAGYGGGRENSQGQGVGFDRSGMDSFWGRGPQYGDRGGHTGHNYPKRKNDWNWRAGSKIVASMVMPVEYALFGKKGAKRAWKEIGGDSDWKHSLRALRKERGI